MLSIIVAVSKNNVIGKDNDLIWSLPNDLKRFRKITTGHTMVMGRKTFESLPGVLKNRHHIILTKNKEYRVNNENVSIVNSIAELFSKLKSDEEIFVIGGGDIYKKLLPFVEKLYITRIDQDFEGDTLFPNIESNEWEVLESEDGILDNENLLPHQFQVLIRK